MGGVIRVMCVEDHPRVVAAIQKLLDMQPGIEVVSVLPRADGMLDAVKRDEPDVVILDLTMVGRDPLDTLAELSRAVPDIRVIIYSGSSDPQLISRAIDAGAWGYVCKGDDPKRIVDAIRAVARGEMLFDQDW
jgi:two-component system response regulator DesR